MRPYDHVLVDVDTQFDFLDPGGALYVPESIHIHAALQRLFEHAKRTRTPVISTADEHSENDPEYQEFGRHCETGTLGQRKLPFTVVLRHRVIRPHEGLAAGPGPLLEDYQQLIFHKDNIDVFVNPHLGALIDTLCVNEYIVFGVATDYCVATAVEGLLARSARVALVTDAVRPISEQQGREALDRFAKAGVRMTRTAEVVVLD